MPASNGCRYHTDNSCSLDPREIERLQYTENFPVLSEQWCKSMLDDYGMDYRKWFPKERGSD